MILYSDLVLCMSKVSEIPVTLENCKPGRIVRRGKDWSWDDEDHQHHDKSGMIMIRGHY